MGRFHRQQVINVALSSSLLFFSSSFLSLNIFTVPIEQRVPSFISIWTRALGFSSIVDSIATLLTASILDVHPTSSSDHERQITRRVRLSVLPVATCYLFLSFSVPAMNHASKRMLYLAVIPQVIPYAFFYLVSIQALMEWIPNHPSVAMTFLSASFGLSQFVFSPTLYRLITSLGLEKAFIVTSFSLFLFVSVLGLLLRYPSPSEAQILKNGLHGQQPSETTNSLLGEDDHETLHWYVFVRTKEFYSYLVTIFFGRAAMALFPYFFKLGYVFNLPTQVVVIIFQVLSLAGICWSLVMNSIYAYISMFKSSPVKLLLFLIFIAQALLYASLIPISIAHNSVLAMGTISLLIIMLESQTAYAIIMAQYIFGSKNGIVVYGLATGLSIGPAEGLFTTLMSMVEITYAVDGVSSPTTFLPFYFIATFCLLVGAVFVTMQTKCSKVFYPNS